ncbi:MAG: alginate lyase family protein [Ginsengibacter sp.]
MKNHLNRRKFLSMGALTMSGLTMSMGSAFPLEALARPTLSDSLKEKGPELTSLPPSKLFSVLNLELHELVSVKRILERKGNEAALKELLNYYRNRFPKPTERSQIDQIDTKRSIQRANDIVNHIFQWGPYPSADYGPDIDWASDPAGDIEWIAAMYRFFWVADLSKAYVSTGDERYAHAFVELSTDWIKKHSLETSLYADHPVYDWRGYAWLDLQTGIRATNLCRTFAVFVHSKAFTSHFLGILLASLYDHQVKTEAMPMRQVHNKAIFEQHGFVYVIHTFPEYKDKERWLDIAIKITHENLIAQTTTDGVQREWCGGYHLAVYQDVLKIDEYVQDLGRDMPLDYQERVEAMADHMFGLSTPELAFPMFGDTARDIITSDDRKTWHLYATLLEASRRFNNPKYQALADLDLNSLPDNGSTAFTSAGLYTLRNGWTPDQVYMAVHCPPPSLNPWHDQPDNGTFELYAYGRWLMPDSGFYTYGNDEKARAWHRQTRVHPTLTINGKNTDVFGRHRHWESSKDADLLCIENYSYQKFLHRRTFWFSEKRTSRPFFVILDEAIGDDKGDIELHFPLAPGTIHIDNENKRITTGFKDVNLLIQLEGKQQPITLYEEEGWYAWAYGKRERRTSVTAVYKGQAPSVFVSVLVPYRGTKAPACRLLTDTSSLIAGQNSVKIAVEIDNKEYILQRKI